MCNKIWCELSMHIWITVDYVDRLQIVDLRPFAGWSVVSTFIITSNSFSYVCNILKEK